MVGNYLKGVLGNSAGKNGSRVGLGYCRHEIMKSTSNSVLDAIGKTPLVELRNLNGKASVQILGKLEGSNPGGSVKDRPAYYMIKKAEESGALKNGEIILEPTSGNTGIALAMIGAAKGYRVTLVMPQCVSMERQSILKAFGA